MAPTLPLKSKYSILLHLFLRLQSVNWRIVKPILPGFNQLQFCWLTFSLQTIRLDVHPTILVIWIVTCERHLRWRFNDTRGMYGVWWHSEFYLYYYCSNEKKNTHSFSYVSYVDASNSGIVHVVIVEKSKEMTITWSDSDRIWFFNANVPVTCRWCSSHVTAIDFNTFWLISFLHNFSIQFSTENNENISNNLFPA